LVDAEAVFRTLAEVAGPHLLRLPDGETGIRKTWIRFLQEVLVEHPAIELAKNVAPFKFTQWSARCCAKSRALPIGRIAIVGRCGKRHLCWQNGAEPGGTGWAMTAMLTAFG
jgi:hypothetical protein